MNSWTKHKQVEPSNFLMGVNKYNVNICGQIMNNNNYLKVKKMLELRLKDMCFQWKIKFSSYFSLWWKYICNPTYHQRPRHDCIHYGGIGHLKDCCYKLHGFSPLVTWKRNVYSPQTAMSAHAPKPTSSFVPSTNMTTLTTLDTHFQMIQNLVGGSDKLNGNMKNTQIQNMTSYLSLRLQSSALTPSLLFSSSPFFNLRTN